MEKYLSKIDAYFSHKSDSEKRIMFGFGAIVSMFLVYSYLFPYSEEYFRATKNQYNSIFEKVTTEQQYLFSVTPTGNPNDMIQNMKSNLTKSNSKLQELNNTNQYVDRKLENLTYLLFNEQAWADFLNKITALAKQYNINVIKLTNSVQDVSVREVKEAVTIELQFNGSFKHILQFINAIEESRMIIDIYELNLIQKETLEGDLKIAIWGMRY